MERMRTAPILAGLLASMALGSFVLLGVGNDGRSSRSVGGAVVALIATFSCGCGEG